jgi:hypothetical protein
MGRCGGDEATLDFCSNGFQFMALRVPVSGLRLGPVRMKSGDRAMEIKWNGQSPKHDSSIHSNSNPLSKMTLFNLEGEKHDVPRVSAEQ